MHLDQTPVAAPERLKPAWTQERLFGERHMIATITLAFDEASATCQFAASIASLETDDQIALWARITYPISTFRDLAEQGLQEVLEVMYDLR